MKTAESHNRTFSNIFHYDSLQTRGLKRVQGLMFRITSSHNTIRILNIVTSLGLDFETLIKYVHLVCLKKDEEIIGRYKSIGQYILEMEAIISFRQDSFYDKNKQFK